SISRVREIQYTRPLVWLATTYQTARNALGMPTLVGVAGAVLAIALLLVPPLPWDVRLPLYLIALVWTILRPRIALYLMALAVPWGSLDYISVGGLRLDSADILVGFLGLGWLLSWALPRYMRGPRDREAGTVPLYLTLAILALIGVMLLSMTVAISRTDSLKEIAKWLEFIVLILLGAQYLRTRRQIWTLIIFIVVAALTQAFFGYAQVLLSLGPQSFVRSFTLRIYGTFDQPNPYAGYLNMALAVTLAITLLGRDWLTRIVAGIASALIGGAMLLTQSRGGQIALLAALIFIVLVGMPRVRIWMRFVIIGSFLLIEGVIAGFIPLYLFEQVERFLGLININLLEPNAQDFSTAERLAHWIAGINMYRAHPILGVGIGNYPDAYPNYSISIFVNPLGHAHNYYINIAAETGTIGLIVYLLFLTAILVAGSRAVQQICSHRRQLKTQFPRLRERLLAPLTRDDKLQLLLHPTCFIAHYRSQERCEAFGQLTNDRALAIGLMAALITVYVHNLVDDLYVHSLTNLLALLLIALIRLGNVMAPMPLADSQEHRASHVSAQPGKKLTASSRFYAQEMKQAPSFMCSPQTLNVEP
ncbi:MAG: O-antigen ligase family protein, partial [Ktedonobacteraceae bacterium]